MSESSDLRLFEHEGAAPSEGDNSPVEHQHLPTSATRVRPPMIVLSFASRTDRERLIEELGLAARETRAWQGKSGVAKAVWPAESTDLRLDV